MSSLSTGLDEEAIIRLAHQPAATRLRELGLSYLHLGHEAITAIACSPFLANLEVLDVSAGQFRDEAAFALAASPHLGKLRALCVAHHQLTASGLAALCERFGLWGADLCSSEALHL